MNKPRTTLDKAATVLPTAAALAVASVYVYGQVTDGHGEVAKEGEIVNWRDDTALGIRIGPADARMVVTEFMDFTCPFCAMLVPAVDSLLARYPADAALVFQHFPLDGRSLSLPSAVAVECAERQDRFKPMYRLLFAQQEHHAVHHDHPQAQRRGSSRFEGGRCQRGSGGHHGSALLPGCNSLCL